MKDPLLSKYGHTFERTAILEWLATHRHCPVTRQPLQPSFLIPNTRLIKEIQLWKKENKHHIAPEDDDDDDVPEEFVSSCVVCGFGKEYNNIIIF
jgi:hypothetical protein